MCIRDRSWAYNEPGSQSGYHVTRFHLARLGETGRYFGRTAVSYTHLRAHETVLDLVCRLLLEKKKHIIHKYYIHPYSKNQHMTTL